MAGDVFVSVDRRPDGVALVRIDRPKANAMSSALLVQLLEVAGDLRARPPGAVVVWGGERMFSSGAEVSEFAGPEAARRIAARFRDAFDAVAAIPRATIAAVNGYALGGGCELALACDLRVVADNARLGQPEILLGIIPGAGATQRLARLVGPARAKDLVLTGRHVNGEEAVRVGLADRVAPAPLVLDTALELARSLASGALAAQALAKSAIDGGLQLSLAEGLDLERDRFVEVFGTEDAAAGVASFLERGAGKARFTGR
jgi:enoyl-CoA hydratase